MKSMFKYIPETIVDFKNYRKSLALKKEMLNALDLNKDISNIVWEFCYETYGYEESSLSLWCELHNIELNLEDNWINPNKFYNQRLPLTKDFEVFCTERMKGNPICVYGNILPQLRLDGETMFLLCQFSGGFLCYTFKGLCMSPCFRDFGNFEYTACTLNDNAKHDLLLTGDKLNCILQTYLLRNEILERMYVALTTKERFRIYNKLIREKPENMTDIEWRNQLYEKYWHEVYGFF